MLEYARSNYFISGNSLCKGEVLRLNDVSLIWYNNVTSDITRNRGCFNIIMARYYNTFDSVQ